MTTSERFPLPPAALPADANVRFQYPIHQGTWIVHPDIRHRESSFCRYRLAFTLEAAATIELHVSADNRFELTCDDAFVGMGPDRSDVEHWSFHSYRLVLEPGDHVLSAVVSFIHEHRACAQTTIEPGFVLVAAGSPVDLDTGKAPWKVARLQGVGTEKAPVRGFFVVGPDYTIDAAKYFAPPAEVAAIPLQPAGSNTGSGRLLPGWKLHPSPLPEQLRQPVGGGVVRTVCEIGDGDPFPAEDAAPDPAWQAFVEGRAPVTVPPRTRRVVLWDLQQYHTAFPELTVSGGVGGRVRVQWAESCFESVASANGTDARRKGHRDEIVGKLFVGNGDTFLPDGPDRTFHTFWWRAGRYIRITVETADAPLTLDRLRLLESRLPFENEGAFETSDAALGGVVALAARGIQMCAHETYMDCPYYEQMMYVGDTRIQMLTAYVMSREDRLNQRGLELFDWSRRETGFVLERYPSLPKQLSATFAMIWVLMLRDHAWWRDEPVFVKERLKGMRCLLEEFKTLAGTREDGLLPALPGWSFMDWVDGLSFVNPPGPDASVASVVNLLFLNSLVAAAELEEAFGEPHLAAYNRAWAAQLAHVIDTRFWNEERGLFAEDAGHTRYSEHAQCLALLSGCFPVRETRCFENLLKAEDLLRTTVYFSFYLLETFAKFGRGDLVLERFGFWKEMVANGLKTPLEMPEPSRSDCHAWGSHPLFHLHASVAGIRPAAPGFRAVRIEPQPGTLTRLACELPHPAGTVALAMRLENGAWHATVSLPDGVEGTLCWAGVEHPLRGTLSFELE